MIRQHLMFGALVAALALPAAAQADESKVIRTPPPAVTVDAAHLAAVTEMLEAVHMGEMFLAGARLERPTEPGRVEFANFILGRITGADVVREVAPVYARLVPEQEARALAAALRRPVAQQALAVQLALIPLSGKAREQKEKAGRPAVSAFYATPEAWRIDDIVRRATAPGKEAVARWMVARYEQAVSAPLKAVAARQLAWIEGGMAEGPVLFVPEPTGLPSVDAFSSVLAHAAYRNQHASWQFQRDLAPMAAASILKPAHLLDPAILARSRLMLDEVDIRIEAHLKLSDGNLSQFAAELQALPLFAQQNAAPFSRALEAQIARGIQFGENQRTMIDLMRRVLVFMAERKGKVRMKGEQLMFDAAGDATLYNALVTDLQREMAVEESFTRETRDKSKRAAEGKY